MLSGGTVENSVNFAGLKAHPLTDPNSASISVTQGAEWMYVVSGRAGANVTSLTVTNPDTGAAVTAALAKGVWSAWWPVGEGSRAWGPTAGGYADGISISYTLIDGTTHVSTNASDTGSDDSTSNLTDNPPALGALPGWAAGAAALTPTPADVNTCAASAAGWPTGSASVVLAETRGGFESLLLDKDGDRAYCVLTAGAVTWSRELGTMPTIDPPTGSSPAPDAPTAALVMDESVDGVVPGTRISTALGTADPGVTAVTLHLAAGHDVQATVANGSWMAWWPEDETAALNGAVVDGTTITAKPAPAPTSTPAPTDAPIPAGPPTLSFTTADGVEHTPVN
ncbi:hypothetical protein [Subtercola sp. RTI3]|uniref:hypothetical protein n=1 Tax=Subtercola sp. RTI3 TaxID=3048639 RepID=UPI002B23097F|nr:hypothetical protein [Subtercola sp. RTI3]MEA9983742.1 hypothetical protein [Subtercola sp. RTI3]